jgi:hypothetical protein
VSIGDPNYVVINATPIPNAGPDADALWGVAVLFNGSALDPVASFAGDTLYNGSISTHGSVVVVKPPVLTDDQLCHRRHAASAVTDANGLAQTTLKLNQKNGSYMLLTTFTPAGPDVSKYAGRETPTHSSSRPSSGAWQLTSAVGGSHGPHLRAPSPAESCPAQPAGLTSERYPKSSKRLQTGRNRYAAVPLEPSSAVSRPAT